MEYQVDVRTVQTEFTLKPNSATEGFVDFLRKRNSFNSCMPNSLREKRHWNRSAYLCPSA